MSGNSCAARPATQNRSGSRESNRTQQSHGCPGIQVKGVTHARNLYACSEYRSDWIWQRRVNFDEWVMFSSNELRTMARGDLVEARLAHSVIGAFYEVFNVLGFGFLEHLYSEALSRELVTRGHVVSREVSVRISYKGEIIGIQRLDMIVDDKLIVEIKAASVLHQDATRQVFNYLRATNLELGLLLHFGHEPRFYRVFHRRAGGHPEHSQ
jgi:GxxExxY protein